ncbi:9-cis-epoxycarotenoid dioxygenase [Roseicella frigidaeris]|uniref:Dioxygenase n=2 Tax=Roseicella frigidaeris TaxID=2230885 RepID=A0A327MCX5_9PROT|nr:9-cis-epoxycarotenoid dioxygenase [Roseicella frigidaeris]
MDLDHLSHGYAPVAEELDLHALPMRGRIPPELAGTWLRNGPNPAFPPIAYAYPWDGDGMIHALRFAEGRVAYANRFVATAGLRAERRAGRALYGSLLRPVPVDPALAGPEVEPGPIKNLANTNVVRHAGRILALWEGGLPHALDERLETLGRHDFDGRLRGAMTAHPKFDPATGEMLIIRYAPRPPFLSFGSVDPAGRLARMDVLSVDRPYMVHDFVCTARHAVFVLCPLLLEPSGAGPRPDGTLAGPIRWAPDLGTRIAVLDRADPAAPLRWFAADPFFTFHFMNAHEAAEGIHIDHLRYPALPGTGAPIGASLWRLTLDLGTGTARERQLDDRTGEFPRIDPRRAGLANRHGWLPVRTGAEADRHGFAGLACHDLAAGRVVVRDFGPGQEVDEPVFLPRPGGTEEGDGWLLTYVYDRAADRSRAVLLEARDLGGEPVAEISLPCRVPHGLHGNWMPA